ncbi:unnamed protein product [Prorocentrum cordatum]|uniref:Tyr recombinase domain-containing protein n=1 Tax=Prorocentrum cordatum TaxID=2364126 RepID=A0ABN9SZU5_9DINO|nr:unnamed protein product [Polarella glacialis]
MRALAGLAIECGQRRVAAAIVLGYHCILRTGELLRVRNGDLELTPRRGRGVVNLHSTERGQRRLQQETVTVDDPPLVKWLATLLEPLQLGDTLVALTQHAFRDFFRHMLLTLGLAQSGFKLYSLRRGGATFHYREFANLHATTMKGR